MGKIEGKKIWTGLCLLKKYYPQVPFIETNMLYQKERHVRLKKIAKLIFKRALLYNLFLKEAYNLSKLVS